MRYIKFFVLTILLSACQKSSDPITQFKKNISGNSSKTWKLSKIIINGTEQPLSQGQQMYNKTYDIDGTWKDSDGYAGTYTFTGVGSMREVTTTGGSYNIDYKINLLNEKQLDIEYTVSQQTYRFVYAY